MSTARAAALDTGRLASVTLAQLTDRAALMTRTDRKYLLPLETAAALVSALAPDLRVLEIDARRWFGYRSTYYETDGLDSFRSAATARRRRFKVRRRDYVDTGGSWLEVKTRTGRGHARKVRRPLTDEAGMTCPGSPPDLASAGPTRLDLASMAFVEGELAAAGVAVPEGRLVPSLVTAYRRTTLLVATEGARLTIDTDLRWSDPTSLPVRQAARLHRLIVVETKSAGPPGAADRHLWAHGHRPVRLSKYATGLALLHDQLPANRWHRTLDRLRADAA